MNFKAFMFDSTYQIITWVLIALAVGSIFYYKSQGSNRGIIWSIVALIIFIALMVGMIADRYVSEDQDTETSPADRPWLSIEITPNGPITYQGTESATIPLSYRITNTGRSPANNVQLKVDVVFPTFGSNPLVKQQQICEQSGGIPFPSAVIFADRIFVGPYRRGQRNEKIFYR
jgi:hypothetical protein